MSNADFAGNDPVIGGNPFIPFPCTAKAISAKNKSYCVAAYDLTGAERFNIGEKLEQLVGRTGIMTWATDIARNQFYHRARAALLCISRESTSLNALISGPPGTGKTTAAILVGGYFAQMKIIPNPIVLLATRKDIKGQYIGESEYLISSLVQTGRGGVIILDEADTLNEPDTFNASIVSALNGAIDKERAHGTVFIFTGYTEGLNQLMRLNDGLSRRFPHRFDFPHFSNTDLAAILDAVFERRGYTVDDDVRNKALKEILRSKEIMGDKFGNAATVESLVDAMENKRASRFDLDALDTDRIDRFPGHNSELAGLLASFDEYDVPRYNGKCFIATPLGGKLSPHVRRTEAPVKPSGRPVLHLRQPADDPK